MEETLTKSSGSADSLELADWQLPLCFTKKRHTEEIKGVGAVVNTWRLKERVSNVHFFFFVKFSRIRIHRKNTKIK